MRCKKILCSHVKKWPGVPLMDYITLVLSVVQQERKGQKSAVLICFWLYKFIDETVDGLYLSSLTD